MHLVEIFHISKSEENRGTLDSLAGNSFKNRRRVDSLDIICSSWKPTKTYYIWILQQFFSNLCPEQRNLSVLLMLCAQFFYFAADIWPVMNYFWIYFNLYNAYLKRITWTEVWYVYIYKLGWQGSSFKLGFIIASSPKKWSWPEQRYHFDC